MQIKAYFLWSKMIKTPESFVWDILALVLFCYSGCPFCDILHCIAVKIYQNYKTSGAA